MEIKKNQEYIVDIIDNGFEGEGIAKINDFTIFVPQGLKGEKVKVLILKVKTSYAFAKIIEIINESESRVIPDCVTYKRCGGCNLRYMKYEKTLELKKAMVENCLKKQLHREVKVEPVLGMKEPFYYRNKLQYPIGLDKNGKAVMGVYANRSHEIIPTNECLIQNKVIQSVANDCFNILKEFGVNAYNEENGKGTLRHIVTRIGIKTNEVMLILVLNERELKEQEKFIEKITQLHPEIKTIVKNINNKNTNVILGQENEIIYGDGYIYDNLGEFRFKISPMSFYQVNPVQTEVLYNTAVEFADLKQDEVILDLYCGIGTIGIFASKNAKKVYGIEIIENAIKDARENAKVNGVENAEYYCGDVEAVLPKIMEKEKITPGVIFIDPPRKGCDEKTIENLLKLGSNKIVYISCNPATFARDVAKLEEKYEIKKVQPVDMFPFTRTLRGCCKIGAEISVYND